MAPPGAVTRESAMFAVMVATTWPVLLWSSLASYGDMKFFWSGYVPWGVAQSRFISPPLTFAAAISVIQALAAILLSRWSIRRVQSTWGSA